MLFSLTGSSAVPSNPMILTKVWKNSNLLSIPHFWLLLVIVPQLRYLFILNRIPSPRSVNHVDCRYLVNYQCMLNLTDWNMKGILKRTFQWIGSTHCGSYRMESSSWYLWGLLMLRNQNCEIQGDHHTLAFSWRHVGEVAGWMYLLENQPRWFLFPCWIWW